MDKLQWGNRKRLRCVKVKDPDLNGKTDGSGVGVGVMKKKITSRVVENNHHNNNITNGGKDGLGLPPVPSPLRPNRELGMSRSGANDNRKASASSSPEKEDRYYTTRGSSGGFEDGNKLLFANPAKEENKKMVWPKLLISLSNKEKEEDFMLMKGCKPPQRPKKRAKLVQRTILLVSPGAWLSDLCQERYEVREKKTSKKKPRGLKAMGTMESDSE
ncbi:uncharacterized protein [Henckelia pumila]|uniref:uncharacterized protein n=1 Tax=Henckelia pumila TaxID=405737 RepID=UPI003C6E7EDA